MRIQKQRWRQRWKWCGELGGAVLLVSFAEQDTCSLLSIYMIFTMCCVLCVLQVVCCISLIFFPSYSIIIGDLFHLMNDMWLFFKKNNHCFIWPTISCFLSFSKREVRNSDLSQLCCNGEGYGRSCHLEPLFTKTDRYGLTWELATEQITEINCARPRWGPLCFWLGSYCLSQVLL